MIYDSSAQNDDPAYQAIRKKVYGQFEQAQADPESADWSTPTEIQSSPDFAPATSEPSPVTTMGAPALAPTETPRVTVPTPVPPSIAVSPAPATTPVAAAATPTAQSVEDAVMQNYQTLGVTPTGPGTGPTDSAYFIRRINETGGMTPDNIKYWFGQDGRIARELRGEVPPEAGPQETPTNRALSPLAPPPAAQIVTPGKPQNSTSGSNHRPGDGTGIPGVYDWNNAGYPVDAMGAPYMGSLQGGEPNPWLTGGGDEGFPIDSGPATPGGGTPAAPKEDTYQEKIRKQIEERMKALGDPVDEQATGISSAVSAMRDEQARAAQQERSALAERLYAQGDGGLQTNALTQQIQQSGERTGIATAGTRANLVLQEYGRRQEELDKYYAMALASGDAEEARKIQVMMAQLQATLQREGYSLDAAKYAAYLNQNAIAMGLNG